MRWLILVCGLLLAAPAFAQTKPNVDPDHCLALAQKMDDSAAGKKKATKSENVAYDDCIVEYNCSKVDARTAPADAYSTSVKRMRYLLQMCGKK